MDNPTPPRKSSRKKRREPQAGAIAPDAPRVSLPETQTWNITSKINQQEYQISVGLPAGYGEGQSAYPVLYLTDGLGSLCIAQPISRWLLADRLLPDLLLVAIGYPTEDLPTMLSLRKRDFTPVEADKNSTDPRSFSPDGTGGGPRFLRFIQEELIPQVNARYRTRPDDTALFGQSLGGLFALHVLFQHPAVFQRFIIGSPSIWWAEKAILQAEAAYAAAQQDLPARVFMGIGGEEDLMVAELQSLAETLQRRNYPNLSLATHVFEDERHLTVIPFVLSRGLRAVYAGDGE
jgi:hypothetical protein